MSALVQDLRYGLRMLRKNPGFTAVAVGILALGIGANTAIFSLIDAIMLRSLPVKDPQQLVSLRWVANRVPRYGGYSDYGGCPSVKGVVSGCSFSFPIFERVRADNHTLSGTLACAGPAELHVMASGEATLTGAELVSGNFFSTLGVKAVLGRTLSIEDERPGAAAVTVLSYGFWQRRFGGDASAVGKPITLNGVPFTIAGVLDPRFQGLTEGLPWDMYIPLQLGPRLRIDWGAPSDPSNWSLWIMGRVKPGVSKRQAQADLEVIFRRATMAGGKPLVQAEDNARLELMPTASGIPLLGELFAEPLLMLMAIVALVLLVACANVANLLLARAAAREREIAVRLALGAGRRRLVRQLITESLVLAALGGGLGVLLAGWGTRLLVAFFSSGLVPGMALDVAVDVRVLAFTVGASVLTGILFGLAPAFRSTRVDLTPALKSGTPGGGLGRRRSRLRLGEGLVTFQVAVSLVLLLTAGLLVRTLENLRRVKIGFNPQNVLLFTIEPELSGYEGNRLTGFVRNLQERFAGLPGVSSASFATTNLLSRGLESGDVQVEGDAERKSRPVDILRVGPHFFETMKIPLLAGRTIDPQDVERGRNVVVINELAARQFLPRRNPLGVRLGWEGQKLEMEIVGVVGNAKYDELRKDILPTIYLPYNGGGAHFELRTTADPASLIPTVRRIVREADDKVPVTDVKTQIEQIDQSLFEDRLIAGLSSLFGVLALVLSCVGLYGVMSYTVARRTNEFGLRMALGAGQRDVLRLVLRQAATTVLAGIALGIPAALGGARLISSRLYGLSPTNPLSIVVAVLLMTGVAALASYIPARRATKVDPIVALRYE